MAAFKPENNASLIFFISDCVQCTQPLVSNWIITCTVTCTFVLLQVVWLYNKNQLQNESLAICSIYLKPKGNLQSSPVATQPDHMRVGDRQWLILQLNAEMFADPHITLKWLRRIFSLQHLFKRWADHVQTEATRQEEKVLRKPLHSCTLKLNWKTSVLNLSRAYYADCASGPSHSQSLQLWGCDEATCSYNPR